jgi:hypothetical protein
MAARRRGEVCFPHIKTTYGFPREVLPNETAGADDQQPGLGWIHS